MGPSVVPPGGGRCGPALLGYLEASKFDAAPRYLGTDGLGRETLSELPGRPCLGPEVDGDELLASAASLIRGYHDLVAGWTYPQTAGRRPGPERAAMWSATTT